jgi:hypothetical protein
MVGNLWSQHENGRKERKDPMHLPRRELINMEHKAMILYVHEFPSWEGH